MKRRFEEKIKHLKDLHKKEYAQLKEEYEKQVVDVSTPYAVVLI